MLLPLQEGINLTHLKNRHQTISDNKVGSKIAFKFLFENKRHKTFTTALIFIQKIDKRKTWIKLKNPLSNNICILLL